MQQSKLSSRTVWGNQVPGDSLSGRVRRRTGECKVLSQYFWIQASAHYFVGHASEGAAVYSSVPEKDTAWHIGAKHYIHPDCRNDNAIGVELCCHQNGSGSWYFDPETVNRAVELAREIMARYKIPVSHVLRHYDVTGKVCPEPFVKDQAAWKSFLQRLA